MGKVTKLSSMLSQNFPEKNHSHNEAWGAAGALAQVRSRALIGLEARPISVEVHITRGAPKFTIVGLPETAVRESRDRVRSALMNCKYHLPKHNITVNLAPADSPKGGCCFDLAIAIGILAASRQLQDAPLDEYEFLGELALGGELRSIPGALPAAQAISRTGHALIVPLVCAEEAALVAKARVLGARNLLEVCAHLTGDEPLPLVSRTSIPPSPGRSLRLSDINGQEVAKRALIVAAAGGHNLLFSGPPGAGKTMLAERLPYLLPPITEEETIEVSALYSVCRGHAARPDIASRPFRAPHHTASVASIIGGGQTPMPGEISLAHRGALFMDEFPEFHRDVLESLREPLESGRIEIARARYRVSFPARFQLIAAMNPCPAGRACDGEQINCVCSPEACRRYQNRLSQPLMDRVDLQVYVPAARHDTLFSPPREEDETDIHSRIRRARELALKRAGKCNQMLAPEETKSACQLAADDQRFFVKAAELLKLTLRGCHRTLRVARTFADLDEESQIRRSHLQEALALRTSIGSHSRERG